jgi:hypothetical protein
VSQEETLPVAQGQVDISSVLSHHANQEENHTFASVSLLRLFPRAQCLVSLGHIPRLRHTTIIAPVSSIGSTHLSFHLVLSIIFITLLLLRPSEFLSSLEIWTIFESPGGFGAPST